MAIRLFIFLLTILLVNCADFQDEVAGAQKKRPSASPFAARVVPGTAGTLLPSSDAELRAMIRRAYLDELEKRSGPHADREVLSAAGLRGVALRVLNPPGRDFKSDAENAALSEELLRWCSRQGLGGEEDQDQHSLPLALLLQHTTLRFFRALAATLQGVQRSVSLQNKASVMLELAGEPSLESADL
jgi:hypothetical protein